MSLELVIVAVNECSLADPPRSNPHTQNPALKSRPQIPPSNPALKSRPQIPPSNPALKSRPQIPPSNPIRKSSLFCLVIRLKGIKLGRAATREGRDVQSCRKAVKRTRL
ncbi:MAG: hypothetical protein DMG81_16635 [Acidobacteria bacterium]|nr:MAG: hypothetical protein DMG81_16635 [Acidobacteriota bacterium]